MIGSIAGAAIGLGTKIFGAVKSANTMKKANSLRDQQMSDNEADFQKSYNEDYLDTAQARSTINKMSAMLEESNRDRGAFAAGMTPEAMLAQRSMSQKTLSDTMSDVAAQGTAYKQQIKNAYMGRKSSLEDAQYNSLVGEAQRWSEFGKDGVSKGISAGGAFDSLMGKS